MRYLIILLAVALMMSFSAGTATAGSPFKEMVLKVIGHTSRTVKEEVNTVGRGIKKGADIVAEEVKDVGSLATGDASKAKDVLIKPVKGASEMAGETAYGVINAPIKAAEEK